MSDEEETASTSTNLDVVSNEAAEEETPRSVGSVVNEESASNLKSFEENKLENDNTKIAVATDISYFEPDAVNDNKPDISEESEQHDLEVSNDDDDISKDQTKINWQEEIDNFDKEKLLGYLNNISEEELLEVLKETEQINSYISQENDVYEFILNKDEMIQNTLENVDVNGDLSAQESFKLSYPAKCYFAKKKIKHIEKELKADKAGYDHQMQDLKFQLESLNMSLQNLKATKEKFDKNIRIGGRHPVTKKIILQKVSKYFDDSIRTKMALANRYKIQIQSDIMEHNKILSQIKAQEKRLASLDLTEFQEAQFEHKRSCRELARYKDQLGKMKFNFSSILQSVTEMKKALEKEESEMQDNKDEVSHLEHVKEVVVTEKSRNDQQVLELKAAMRKIKLDPRRHTLPEVIDYAAAKRENAALKKNVKKWRKKVEQAKQEKLLYLNSCLKNP